MFNIAVEWLDEDKSRARFALPGREEWNAEHISALMQVLAQIREEMAPAVPSEPSQLHEERKKISSYFAEQEAEWQKNREPMPL